MGKSKLHEKYNRTERLLATGEDLYAAKSTTTKKNWRFDAKGKTCLKPEEKVDEKKTHKAIDAVLHAKKRMNMGDIPPYEDDLAH